MAERILLSPPHLTGSEADLLCETLASNWIAPLGPQVDAFEQELAAVCGVSHAAALSSGTAALHLGLLLSGVGEGDAVLLPTLTFAATAFAVRYVGAEPVFLDSEAGSWNIDPELLAEELAARQRAGTLPAAVIAVDLYGQCADYDRIVALCDRHGVPLIEDAAEALGASYRGRPAASFGRCATLSFNGNKIITTSGGGALVSDDGELVARARSLGSQARDPAPHYQHSEIGYNYRMSNLLAAVGRAQLRVLAERVAARRRNFELYRQGLGDLPGIAFVPEAAYGRSTRWLTVLTVAPQEFGATREDIRLALERENIESRPVWKPLHLQPVFAGCRIVGGSLAEDLFARGLCLPSGSSLEEHDRQRVIDAVRGVHSSSRNDAPPRAASPTESGGREMTRPHHREGR
jgi:pyridoxal phosphate-dependent aminotransferase EpsN